MTDNVLEAMILPTTSKEIDNGMFERFISQLMFIDPSDITFIIMINNIEHKTDIMQFIDKIQDKFKFIEIAYANIPEEDDIYTTVKPKVIPQYGLTSGPNILFFQCMEFCKRFNTTLLIETDCYVKPNFLKILENYTKHAGGFLIAGTTYDGLSFVRHTSPDFFHLNGVALYKTSDSKFHHMIIELEKYIIECVKSDEPFLAYDIAMTRMIFRNMSLENSGDDWKRVWKRCIKTNLIVNLSPPRDALKIDISKYPEAVIIHKKFTGKDASLIPEFLVQEMDQ